MTARHLEPVSGHPDEAREAGVPRLDGRAEGAVLAHRDVPFVLVDEVMQLDEIDVVDAQTAERQPDLVTRLGVRAPAGLRCEEEPVAAFALQPGRDM